MSVPAEIFRTYDIRGVVGRSLTPEIVRDIGRALGTIGRERKAPAFAVCRDGRLSGHGDDVGARRELRGSDLEADG